MCPTHALAAGMVCNKTAEHAVVCRFFNLLSLKQAWLRAVTNVPLVELISWD